MKVASFVDSVAMSQCSYDMIRSFNQISSYNIDTCCFYLNLAPVPINMNFGLLNSYYLPFWDGSIFSTTLQTAHIIQKTYGNLKHFLYLQDLEWLRNAGDFHVNSSILRKENTIVVARSLDHADAIWNYCNIRPKHILENWNSSQILEIINEHTKNN